MDVDITDPVDLQEFVYRKKVPLFENLGTAIGSIEDLGYHSGEGDFVKGRGCKWKETRRVQIEIEISRRNRVALDAELSALRESLLEEIVKDMQKRECVEPCKPQPATKERLSKVEIWDICHEMIQDPKQFSPYEVPEYRHYICLTLKEVYQISVECK